jgi:hypothetical protein
MAWAKVTNLQTGEHQWDSTPDLYDPELYDVLAIVDDRCPEGLEDVNADGHIFVPLELKQIEVWNRVKAIRYTRENDVAPTPLGHQVQIDEPSKAKINGVLSMARLAEEAGATFSEHFTMADNAVIELNSVSVRQLALAAAQHVSAIYARARDLRDQIYAAEVTLADLDAIDVESGWPAV